MQSIPALGTPYVVKIFAFGALSLGVDDGEACLVERRFLVDEGSCTHSDMIL